MADSAPIPEVPPVADFLDLVPEGWLRRVPGRETFAWPAGPRPTLAVKRFAADDRRDVWYERLRGRSPRPPAQREFDNLVALARDGFPVPAALDWAQDPSRGTSVLLMGWIGHRETLRDRLERAAVGERQEHLARLAQLVARLHRAGYYHRDLYLHHFVLADGKPRPTLTLLDLGRVRRERAPRRRWLIKDLGALSHSFPSSVPASEREAFFGRYFDLAGPDTLAARARWLRAIERRRRRIAAHVPRFSGQDAQETE